MSYTNRQLLEDFFSDKHWHVAGSSFLPRFIRKLADLAQYYPITNYNHQPTQGQYDDLWFQDGNQWFNVTFILEEIDRRQRYIVELINKQMNMLSDRIGELERKFNDS